MSACSIPASSAVCCFPCCLQACFTRVKRSPRTPNTITIHVCVLSWGVCVCDHLFQGVSSIIHKLPFCPEAACITSALSLFNTGERAFLQARLFFKCVCVCDKGIHSCAWMCVCTFMCMHLWVCEPSSVSGTSVLHNP